MKITCGVEISNRAYPTISARNKIKYSVATLALCSKTNKKEDSDKDDAYIVLLTHQNQNHKGTKYKVYNNIEKLFTKFIDEGKATVRFKEPPLDVILSNADPLQLKVFLQGVRLTTIGQGNGKVHLSAPPTKVESVAKQKLAISKRSEYPAVSGFPASLVSLQVQSCDLKKVDQRILQLKNLQVLDLSHNCIKQLPLELSQMKLKELILHHNEITCFPNELATGPLGQNLHNLDLSHNLITWLSPYFCLMKNILSVSLNFNKLTHLPRNIHCLKSLRMLKVSNNELTFLPIGIRKLQLNSLDLFNNPLNNDVVLPPVTQWELPSLMEIAASSVVKQNIPLTPDILPSTVIDYIVEHSPCRCGKMVFQKVSYCILLLELYKLASTVYFNSNIRFQVPLKVYFCSPQCWTKFKMVVKIR